MNRNHTNRKKQKKRSQVIISGIGTGGHYFPAIVVAQELARRKIDVVFLVRKGYSEEAIIKMYGFKTFIINPRAFYGKPLFSKILSIFSVLHSLFLLQPLTRRMIGIAFGGFGALPLVLSCLINRSPFYLFEPNRIPGRATKLFASRAKKVFLGLPLVTELTGDAIVTGIPIRDGFKTYLTYGKKRETRKKVLFLGGSQGARRLNRLALEVQGLLSQEYQLIVISGKRDYDWMYSKRNGRTTVIPFTLSPWDAIHAADVIISRSGALCGYEILSLNKPAIFIPFPYAIDNHQYYNAEYFTQVGNAVLFDEKKLTKELLTEEIEKMLHRAVQKKSKIIVDAEKTIVDVLLRENCYEYN